MENVPSSEEVVAVVNSLTAWVNDANDANRPFTAKEFEMLFKLKKAISEFHLTKASETV